LVKAGQWMGNAHKLLKEQDNADQTIAGYSELRDRSWGEGLGTNPIEELLHELGRWVRLHRLIYVIAILAVWHFY